MGFFTPILQDVDYTGPSITGHSYVHLCNVFMPNHKDGETDPTIPVPPGGYPVLVAPILTGFSSTTLLSQINEAGGLFLAYALNHGIAVVTGRVTVSRSDSLGGLPPTSGSPIGTAYPGNGVVIPPGVTPTGYTGSGVPFQDVTRHNPLKDFVMLCQYVKTLADSREDMNGGLLASWGSSAGSAIQPFVTWSKDRSADCFPSPSGQELIDTRDILQASVWVNFPGSWWPIYKQDGVGVDGAVRAYMFPQDLGAGAWDQPARDFEDTVNTYQSSLSGINFSATTGADAENYPVRIRYSEAATAANPPNTFNNIPSNSDVELVAHSPWHGQTAKTKFPDAVRLVLTSNAALTGFETTSVHDELLLATQGELNTADVEWLKDQLGWVWPYEPAPAITTYATLDLIREGGATRSRTIRTNGSSATEGGQIGYKVRAVRGRNVDEWKYILRRSTPGEIRHIETVWQRCGRGALPFLAKPPEGGGYVPCVFVDRTRPYSLSSASQGGVVVNVRRFHG